MLWAFSVIAVYLLICLVLYAIQERFLFHPEKLEEDFSFQYPGQEFEELFFEPKEEVRINALHFKCASPKGLVMYFHGNTRSLKGWGKLASDFTRRGWEVVMMDYRGFGKSEGKRSEYGLKNDALYVYNEILKRVPEDKVIIYGRSMGSGFAAKVASNGNPALLILEAPYYSLHDVARRYLIFIPLAFLLRYKVRTWQWMQYVHCPVLIIHGKKDWLIPWRSAEKLSRIRQEQSRFVLIEGAGHNDLREKKDYEDALNRALGKFG